MAQNFQPIDVKPQLERVIDVKPQLFAPNLETEQYYSVTLGAGMYMGIPLLTYPVAITILSPITA